MCYLLRYLNLQEKEAAIKKLKEEKNSLLDKLKRKKRSLDKDRLKNIEQRANNCFLANRS